MTRYFMTIPEAVRWCCRPAPWPAAGTSSCSTWVSRSHRRPRERPARLAGLVPSDIPIVYTGLRPGEKLTEELWEPDSIISRVDEHVLSVREPTQGLAGQALRQFTDQLILAADRGDTRDVRAFC